MQSTSKQGVRHLVTEFSEEKEDFALKKKQGQKITFGDYLNDKFHKVVDTNQF